MKQLRNFILSAGIILALTAFGQGTRNASLPVIATSASVPGTVFRDCPDCPEMVVIPAGKFMMGSSELEKSWAAGHGASLGSVSDESPQHNVTLPSFALGKYDVTRDEYAAFVRESGHPAGDGCYESSMPKSNKRANANWRSPGIAQTGRDPVVPLAGEQPSVRDRGAFMVRQRGR